MKELAGIYKYLIRAQHSHENKKKQLVTVPVTPHLFTTKRQSIWEPRQLAFFQLKVIEHPTQQVIKWASCGTAS